MGASNTDGVYISRFLSNRPPWPYIGRNSNRRIQNFGLGGTLAGDLGTEVLQPGEGLRAKPPEARRMSTSWGWKYHLRREKNKFIQTITIRIIVTLLWSHKIKRLRRSWSAPAENLKKSLQRTLDLMQRAFMHMSEVRQYQESNQHVFNNRMEQIPQRLSRPVTRSMIISPPSSPVRAPSMDSIEQPPCPIGVPGVRKR